MSWYSYDRPAYVTVEQRRRRAAKKIAKLKKAGRDVSPVEIGGRKIAATFWGEAWCRNLESYSDYSNRLPRGRRYVRNGSVIDLQVEAGRVRALVSGTYVYEVDIAIKSLAKRRWTAIKGECAGQIGSLVELLQGSISKGVMEIVSRKHEGLFPAPREISLSCSCPDWASMCKHVAATLYGVGARLDHAPELLFTLRGVDPTEMVAAALERPPIGGKPGRGRALAPERLSSVFGIDIDEEVDIDAAGASAGAVAAQRGRGRRAVRRSKRTKAKTPRKGKVTKAARASKKRKATKAKRKRKKTKAAKAKTTKTTARNTKAKTKKAKARKK